MNSTTLTMWQHRAQYFMGFAMLPSERERRAEISKTLSDILNHVRHTPDEAPMAAALRAFNNEVGWPT